MLSAFANTFKIPELRQRILFTLGLVFICRLIAAIPLPGLDVAVLRDAIADMGGGNSGGLSGMLNLSAGAPC